MSKEIIVGSMNIQNKYKITDYDGMDEYGNDNAEVLKNFLDEYNIDILGTQELVRGFITRIKKYIKPEYNIYGNFRFGNTKIVEKVDLFNRFNETVSIITKHKVLKNKTVTLPWIPNSLKDIIKGIRLKSLRPRVATITLVNIKDFGKINFINTHLDHRLSIIQIKQLNYLQKLIEKSNYPVILTGDFNMTTDTPRFRLFIENLESIGYKRVPNNKLTYKHQKDKLPIDHIFVPNNYNIEEIKIAKDKYLDTFSDHYPIIVRLSK